MYKNPVVLGIFSNKETTRTNLQDLFLQFGNNTGNMLFSESLLRSISGAKPATLGLALDAYEAYDCVILAAANWLNSAFDFGSVADKLEKTNLPIVVVGIGAQSGFESTIPDLKEGTKRLIKLVSERSSKISVRGDFSAEVLAHYGIKNVTVTGCPSLLLAGGVPPLLKPYKSELENLVAMGSTRHGFNNTDTFQIYLYRQAFRKNLDLVLQSELADMYFSTGRTNNADITARATKICGEIYHSDSDELTTYLGKKAKVFFDLDEWISYMSGKSLYFGTRLHGAIASLLAGTPAVLVCHDARTLEVARVLRIPHVLSTELDTSRNLDINSFYRNEDMKVFQAGYATYRTTFKQFFEENGLIFGA